MKSTSQHIYLASRADEESRALRRLLEPLTGEFYPLQFTMTRPRSLLSLIDQNTTSIVIQTSEWSDEEAKWVEELRVAGYRGPVILVVKNRVTHEKRELSARLQVVFLDRSGDGKDVVGILRKYLAARNVQQQVYERYPTSEFAEIEFSDRPSASYSQASRLTNLSKGGAYLEFLSTTKSKAAPPVVGETVRLKLTLSELNRSYTMAAKVVWTRNEEGARAQGVGVEFLVQGVVQLPSR